MVSNDSVDANPEQLPFPLLADRSGPQLQREGFRGDGEDGGSTEKREEERSPRGLVCTHKGHLELGLNGKVNMRDHP